MNTLTQYDKTLIDQEREAFTSRMLDATSGVNVEYT